MNEKESTKNQANNYDPNILPDNFIFQTMSYLDPKEIFQLRRTNQFFNRKISNTEFLRLKIYKDFITYFGYTLSLDELLNTRITLNLYQAAAIVFFQKEKHYKHGIMLLQSYINENSGETPEVVLYLLVKLFLLTQQPNLGENNAQINENKKTEIEHQIASLEARQSKKHLIDSNRLNMIEIEAMKQQYKLLTGTTFDPKICQLVVNYLSSKDKTLDLSPEDINKFINFISKNHFLNLLKFGSVHKIMATFYTRFLESDDISPFALHLASHPQTSNVPIALFRSLKPFFEKLSYITKDVHELTTKLVKLLHDISEITFSQFDYTTTEQTNLFLEAFDRKVPKEIPLLLMKIVNDYYQIQKKFTKDFNLVNFVKSYPVLTKSISNLTQINKLLNCSDIVLQRLENLFLNKDFSKKRKYIILSNADNKVLETLTDKEIAYHHVSVLNRIFQVPQISLPEVIDDLRVLSKNKSIKLKVNTVTSLQTMAEHNPNFMPEESDNNGYYKRKLEKVELEFLQHYEKRMRLKTQIAELEEELHDSLNYR